MNDHTIQTHRPATYTAAKVANIENKRIEIRDRITIPVNRTLDPLLCIAFLLNTLSNQFDYWAQSNRSE